jgi:Domain of unknown function (DUF4338)
MTLEMAADGHRVVLRYRNREITPDDLEFLTELCAAEWGKRSELFRAVCDAWDWRQANGSPALYACSDLLLRLEERGLLELPLAKPEIRRRRWLADLPIPVDLIPLVGLDVRDPEADLRQVCVRPIQPEERLGWRVYMERYHPLGDRPIVGEHLLYAAFIDDELVALLGWAAAAFRAPLRDTWVGWDEATKRRRLHLVSNNIRFLILPWVRVRHLASKILAMNVRRLAQDWEQAWNHPVVLAETFVDTNRYRGTCYRAANWLPLGQTAGRSKRGNQYLRGATKKSLFVYPLHRHARRLLVAPSSGDDALRDP